MQSQRIGKACTNYTSPWEWHCIDLGQRIMAGWRRFWEINLSTPGWKEHTSICVSSSFGKASISFTKMLLLRYRTTNKAKENFADITKNSYSLNGCSPVKPAWAIIAKARSGLHCTLLHLSNSICKEHETLSPPLPADVLNISKMEEEEKWYYSNWA